MIDLRSGTCADAQPIAALNGELGYATTLAEMRERLDSLLGRDDHSVIVATADGQVAGWIHVSEVFSLESGTGAEIRGLS